MDLFYEYRIINKIQLDSPYYIYRGIHPSDQTSVLIKTINPQLAGLEASIWLQNEYEILQDLNLTGIIQPYSLEKYKNSFALILEDFGGEYLERFLNTQQLTQENFFTIAIELVTTLQKLHENQIIHKNIQPSSIVIHPETLEVKITEFSIASNLASETNRSSPQLEASNLAYISPEQTGRMNFPLDYRTDFYSLGIVFYQMLTGKLPFSVQNSLQLIHCHLAQTPISPEQINPAIDATVSSLVMKLLAKNPEERYQSAYGIKADLSICQIQSQNQGQIKPFELGKLDQRSQFTIPLKLYGCSLIVNAISSSLERVFSGTTEMILLKGDSGTGKTSVVYQVTQPLVKQKGYFIAGKFERLKGRHPLWSNNSSFSWFNTAVANRNFR